MSQYAPFIATYHIAVSLFWLISDRKRIFIVGLGRKCSTACEKGQKKQKVVKKVVNFFQRCLTAFVNNFLTSS